MKDKPGRAKPASAMKTARPVEYSEPPWGGGFYLSFPYKKLEAGVILQARIHDNKLHFDIPLSEIPASLKISHDFGKPVGFSEKNVELSAISEQIKAEVAAKNDLQPSDARDFFKKSIQQCINKYIQECYQKNEEIEKRRTEILEEYKAKKDKARAAINPKADGHTYAHVMLEKTEAEERDMLKCFEDAAKVKFDYDRFKAWGHWIDRIEFLVRAYVVVTDKKNRSGDEYFSDLWKAFADADLEKKADKVLRVMKILAGLDLELANRILIDNPQAVIKINGIQAIPEIMAKYYQPLLRGISIAEYGFLKEFLKAKRYPSRPPVDRDFFRDFILVAYFSAIRLHLTDSASIIKMLVRLGVCARLSPGELRRNLSLFGLKIKSPKKPDFRLFYGKLPPSPTN